MKNGLAVKNFFVSVVCDNGAGGDFLYHLESDASRQKMVKASYFQIAIPDNGGINPCGDQPKRNALKSDGSI